jgi:hypothetical protein
MNASMLALRAAGHPGQALALQVEDGLDPGVGGRRDVAGVEVAPGGPQDPDRLRAPVGVREVEDALLGQEGAGAQRAELHAARGERRLARDVVAGGDDAEGDPLFLGHRMSDRRRLDVAGRADVVGRPRQRARHFERLGSGDGDEAGEEQGRREHSAFPHDLHPLSGPACLDREPAPGPRLGGGFQARRS